MGALEPHPNQQPARILVWLFWWPKVNLCSISWPAEYFRRSVSFAQREAISLLQKHFCFTIAQVDSEAVIQNEMVELSHLLSVYHIQQDNPSCALSRNQRCGMTYHPSQSHFLWQIDRTWEVAAHGYEMGILSSNSDCESPSEWYPPYDAPKFWWFHFESRNLIGKLEWWKSWLNCWRNHSIIVTALFLKAKKQIKVDWNFKMSPRKSNRTDVEDVRIKWLVKWFMNHPRFRSLINHTQTHKIWCRLTFHESDSVHQTFRRWEFYRSVTTKMCTFPHMN
jgi:hypothetical protein